MVVRRRLGASRARVVAQIVTDGPALALAAAALGLVVAQTTGQLCLAQDELRSLGTPCPSRWIF